ncbi:MAG: hypothetical protein KC635_01155 [Myxococcales bacterium]|nr:hypothetical protein [Myxococcales bacterium]MCB9735984.1 hypothetical protein [Deltaproteobacteria bacterium]
MAELRPSPYRALAAELLDDLRALDAVVARFEEHTPADWSSSVPHQALAALTAELYYTGIETAFERVARAFEGAPPPDGAWHVTLARRMALAIDGVRPAVLTEATLAGLDTLRRFRHFVRHAYTATLEPARLEEVVAVLRAAHPAARAEIAAFAALVAQIET